MKLQKIQQWATKNGVDYHQQISTRTLILNGKLLFTIRILAESEIWVNPSDRKRFHYCDNQNVAIEFMTDQMERMNPTKAKIKDVTLQFYNRQDIEDLQSIIQNRQTQLRNLLGMYPDNEKFKADIYDELGRMEEHDRRLEEAKK